MEQAHPPVARKKKSRVWIWLAAFVAVGMLITIGIWVVLIDGYSAIPTATPVGAFHSWTKISKNAYSIEFGPADRWIFFDECEIRISPAVGIGSVEVTAFNLTDNAFIQAATATSPGIIITDLNANERIDLGDFVTVTTRSSGYAAVDNGDWTIQWIFIKTGGLINSLTFTVSGNP
jgi:hypothetical protein